MSWLWRNNITIITFNIHYFTERWRHSYQHVTLKFLFLNNAEIRPEKGHRPTWMTLQHWGMLPFATLSVLYLEFPKSSPGKTTPRHRASEPVATQNAPSVITRERVTCVSWQFSATMAISVEMQFNKLEPKFSNHFWSSSRLHITQGTHKSRLNRNHHSVYVNIALTNHSTAFPKYWP